MRTMEAQRGKEKCCFNFSHLAIKYDFHFITRKKGLEEGVGWSDLDPSLQKNIFLRKHCYAYTFVVFFPLFLGWHGREGHRAGVDKMPGRKAVQGMRMLVWEQLDNKKRQSGVGAQREKAPHYKGCWGQNGSAGAHWSGFFFFTRTCYNLVQAYRAVSGLGLTT